MKNFPGRGPLAIRHGSSTRADCWDDQEKGKVEYLTWRWWPNWHRLRTHHMYEVCYVSVAIQPFGATLYGVTGVVNLPGILDSLKPWQENWTFWIPPIMASVCFLTAGFSFTVETQQKCYKPEFGVLGWHIGLWAGEKRFYSFATVY
jgi:hypothetical protein